MKFLKIVLTVVFFGFSPLLLVINSSANSFFNNRPSLKIEKERASLDKSARELYAQNCARCHGADGRGDTELGRTFDITNIADGDWQKKHSDAKISRKIARGGGGMPAFAKKLSPKEINNLVNYVRSLKK